jgi:hypothetical protein
MRTTRLRRGTLGLLAGLGAVLPVACTHNHYYGSAVPVCPPTTAATTTVLPDGAICDVGTPVVVGSGSTTTTSPVSSSVAAGGGTAQTPRVVVSQPSTGSRLSWRRSDPDSTVATTRVEGALDDTTISR